MAKRSPGHVHIPNISRIISSNAIYSYISLRFHMKRRQHHIVFQFKSGFWIAFAWHEIYHQRVLDCKHGIVLQVLALLVEYLCCYGLEIIVGDLFEREHIEK